MRKRQTITIEAEGRDKGKTFVIIEMPASQAQSWAHRALEAIAQRSDIPSGVAQAGMLGIFIMGLKPILAAPWPMVEPLLKELFDSCLSIQPNLNDDTILRGRGTDIVKPVGKLLEEDIEEVSTRLFLQDKIFELHTGFSVATFLSQQWKEVVGVAKAFASLNIQTSDKKSEPSSVSFQQ